VTETMIRQALSDSVNEVLEKMFFVQTLGEAPVSEPRNDTTSDEIAVRLTFEGDPPGSLTLRVTAQPGRQIAADFLGTEEDSVSDLQVSEVVCELANMICGSLLSRVESVTTFHLAAPRVVPSSEDVAGSIDNIRYAVELSGGTLTVKVTTGITKWLQPAQSAY